MSRFRYFRHHMPYLPRDACSGKLIVIEGTDGTGRSTQASMLREWQGVPIRITSPGISVMWRAMSAIT